MDARRLKNVWATSTFLKGKLDVSGQKSRFLRHPLDV